MANTFTYDAAGRLTAAVVGGRTLSYGFATTTACPQNQAGTNTNRTTFSDTNGGTPINYSYCYDVADRLTSSTDAAVGTPVYDNHGNTTTLGNQVVVYDGADRHMATTAGTEPTVSYVRDALDRIVERKVGGTTVATYGFSGPGDSPSITSYGGVLAQRHFVLPERVLYSKNGPNGDRWSYPNLHGDIMAVADAVGTKQGSTIAYDPLRDGNEHPRQRTRQLRQRLARLQPAPARAPGLRRHHRDGGTALCARPGAVPGN